MTNFNESPYEIMWFPTEDGSRKILDLLRNPKVLVTFPGSKKGEFYEIEGKAELASQKEVDEKWRWWYLYWHPEQSDRFWFPRGMKNHKRAIINVYPISAKLIRK
jgi:general stress protein 26